MVIFCDVGFEFVWMESIVGIFCVMRVRFELIVDIVDMDFDRMEKVVFENDVEV